MLFGVALEEDLARRDFTVNAMAYAQRSGLIDPFSGAADLDARLIRCVGKPQHRFEEDALRILRALPLAAQLDFQLHTDTAARYTAVPAFSRNRAASASQRKIDRLILCPRAGHLLAAQPSLLPFVSEHWRSRPSVNRLPQKAASDLSAIPAAAPLSVVQRLQDPHRSWEARLFKARIAEVDILCAMSKLARQGTHRNQSSGSGNSAFGVIGRMQMEEAWLAADYASGAGALDGFWRRETPLHAG